MVLVPVCALLSDRAAGKVVTVKSGTTTVTVTGICSVWLRLPLVAVMVTDPLAAESEEVTDRTLVTGPVGLAVMGLGLNAQVRPGDPLQEKLTLPAKLCTGEMLIPMPSVWPLIMVRLGPSPERVKSELLTDTGI